jgi:hypothetical protein
MNDVKEEENKINLCECVCIIEIESVKRIFNKKRRKKNNNL